MVETTIKSIAQLKRAPSRAVERWTVVAVMLFALLLIGEAAVFMYAARTIPDFLINYYAVP